MNLYNDDFYIVRDEETRNAANTVLSIVSQIFSINSMVDVGCGVGTWLNEFHKIKKGQCNIVGIDGNYVNRELLTIEKDRFLPMDLESQIELSEKFDLAISLEVAEHLSIGRAEGFVNDLTKLSPVILFSAAFPNQGGGGTY